MKIEEVEWCPGSRRRKQGMKGSESVGGTGAILNKFLPKESLSGGLESGKKGRTFFFLWGPFR